MRKLIFSCFIFVFLTACSADDENSGEVQDLVEVVSVSFPENLVHRSSHQIEVVYRKPTSCHRFLGFDLIQNRNEIRVGVVNNFLTGNENCRELQNVTATATLNFVAERDDFYIFKFWRGKNAANQDVFLTKEISVIQPGN